MYQSVCHALYHSEAIVFTTWPHIVPPRLHVLSPVWNSNTSRFSAITVPLQSPYNTVYIHTLLPPHNTYTTRESSWFTISSIIDHFIESKAFTWWRINGSSSNCGNDDYKKAHTNIPICSEYITQTQLCMCVCMGKYVYIQFHSLWNMKHFSTLTCHIRCGY